MKGQAAKTSRPVIAIASAIASSNRRNDQQEIVAEVERLLASTLGGSVPKAQVARAASFLVQAVQPLLEDDSPDAAQILAALRSSNPLREPRIAAAFANAMLELQQVAVALDVTAAHEASQ